MSFKRLIALMLVVLVAIMSFSACSDDSGKTESEESKSAEASGSAEASFPEGVADFAKYLNDSAYTDAIAEYNKNISGNAKLEMEAAGVITGILDEIEAGVLSGSMTEADAKAKSKTVQNVYQAISCEVENYDQLQADITVALESKVAYKSGISLFDSKNYPAAITELKKVLPADADYANALVKIDEAAAAYKADVTAKATAMLSENNYSGAMELYSNAIAVLSEDSDLLAAQNTCKQNHIAYLVAQAEVVFADYTKYSEALAFIQSGIQAYPDDATLTAKRDYYNTFAPVYVYDMKALKGTADTRSTDTDIYGNVYEKSFWSGYSSGLWNSADISYNLDKKYNSFTATIYCRSSRNEAQRMVAEIYADGKVIYQNLNILDNATQPFDIELDVTGVSELRIVLTRDAGAIGSGIGMTNMILQKTAK